MLALALLVAAALPAPASARRSRSSRCAVAAHVSSRRTARACTRTRRKRGHTRVKAAHSDSRRVRTRSRSSSAEAEAAAEAARARIAAVLATPCENTEITPEGGNLVLVREAVLCLINRKRAENGEQPLIVSADLQAAAESHASELIADDYFAHVSPSGLSPAERIRETGYIPSAESGYVIGENLAWGTFELSTPLAIAQAWFHSPEHLANILEAQYRETGVGVVAAVPASYGDGAPGATYAQEFGVVFS